MNELMMNLLVSRGYLAPADENGSNDGMKSSEKANSDDGNKDAGDNGRENDQDSGDKDSKDDKGNSDDPDPDRSKDSKDKSDDKLDDKTAKVLKDLMKWKDKARSTEDQNKTLSTQLEKVQKVLGDDVTLDDVAELLKSRKDEETKELERKGEYDRIVEQMKTENQKSVDSLSEQNAELVKANEALLAQIDDMTIGRAFSDSSFIREDSLLPPSIARKEFAPYVDFVDGSMVVYDKPRGAKERTPIVDANGDAKSFELGMADLFAKHPDSKSLLRSKRKPGAGSKSQDSAGGKTIEKRSSSDKIQSGLRKLDGE